MLQPEFGSPTTLIDRQTLADRVGDLARQISADYADKPLLIVGGRQVRGCSWPICCALSIPVSCDFVMLSSYGERSTSSGQISLKLDRSFPVEGRHLLLVEDIIDTGNSMPWLIRHLQQKSPASVRLCALLDKPARRKAPVTIDYLGFTVPDQFIVGYGIDYAEQYRHLDFVGCLDLPS